jgi:hypothetical protein
MPTTTMLSQNGRHYPQSRNWSPEIQLQSSTIRLARNRPDGPPYCGHEVMKPRCASVFARDQRRATPFTADAHALMNRTIVRITAPQMPIGAWLGTKPIAKLTDRLG